MKLQTFESHGVCENAEYSPLQVKKILVPVDFSAASKKAFRHALSLATQFASDLIVLYVVPPGPTSAFAAVDGGSPFSDTPVGNIFASAVPQNA